ncbi:MAG: universal stress protein [Parvularculales bacterium]
MNAKSDTQAPRKFLVVIDGTPESHVALRFAARRALHTNGIVSLLVVLEPEGFQHWLGVQDIMEEEARGEAEALLHRHAADVNAITGAMPELVVREGRKTEEVRALIEEDNTIAVLVLAVGEENKDNPGPLVSLLTQSAAFTIPVTLVPGNLTDDQIDALA